MSYLDSYGYNQYGDEYYDRPGYGGGVYDRPGYGEGSYDRSGYGEGSYDLAGNYSRDYGHDYDVPFRDDMYDDALHHNYYTGEDDYYGSYGALMDYEQQLRLMEDISENERLRRWNERLAFEELEERERQRRYQLMAEEEKIRLGLIGDSWWNSRYGYGRSGHGSGGWRSRYGNRLGAWTSSRLPLSSRLANRFGRMWGAGETSQQLTQQVTQQVRRDRGRDRLYALEQQLEYAKDRARLDAVAEGERIRMQLEARRIEDELERIRLQVQLDEERARSDLRRQELVREAELREDIMQMNEEERLRRQIDAIGRGYY